MIKFIKDINQPDYLKLGKILINKNLFFLSIILVIINLFYFKPAIHFYHDTMQVAAYFHYFYSNLLYYNEIPQWLPYSAYGLKSNAVFLCFTPSFHLVGLIGWLFRVENTLLLTKLAILLDQFMFLTGIFLLAKLLFSQRLTIFIVSFGTIVSLVIGFQIYWNYSLFFLVPWMIYFTIRFFKTNQIKYIWLVGIISIIQTFYASVLYMVSIYLLVITIIFLVYFIKEKTYKDKDFYKSLISINYKNILLFSLFIILAIIVVQYSNDAYDGMLSFASGRDDVSYKTDINTFLTYGSVHRIKFIKIIYEFLSGISYNNVDMAFYIGILPLVFALVAIAKVRKTSFLAFLILTIILIGFSAGGLISRILYYFPLMDYFRHIAYIYPLTKIMILFCAGFGLDYYLNKIEKCDDIKRYFSLKWLSLIFSIFLSIIIVSFTLNPKPLFLLFAHFFDKQFLTNNQIALVIRFLTYLTGVIILYFIIQKKQFSNLKISSYLKIIFLICFMVDLLSFRILNYVSTPVSKNPEHISNVFKATPLTYQNMRVNKPFTLRQKQALELLENDTKYVDLFNFIQLDTCYPKFRTDSISNRVEPLIRLRGGNTKQFPSNSFLPRLDISFKQSIGCFSPKIRLVEKAIFTKTLSDTINTIKDTKNLNNTVILRKKNLADKYQYNKKMLSTEPYMVSSNNLSSHGIFWQSKESTSYPYWIRFTINKGSAKIITKYSVYVGKHGKDSTHRMATDWRFQGSNNGLDWDIIDEQNAETNFTNNETRIYEFKNRKAYTYYRWYITKGLKADYLRIYELDFPELNKQVISKTNEEKLEVNHFSANRIKIQANVRKKTWLVYADTYHPDWKAMVNGNSVNIYESNLAFKAVQLNQGNNIVIFKIDSGLKGIVVYIISIIAILFSISILGTLGCSMVCKVNSASSPSITN